MKMYTFVAKALSTFNSRMPSFRGPPNCVDNILRTEALSVRRSKIWLDVLLINSLGLIFWWRAERALRSPSVTRVD